MRVPFVVDPGALDEVRDQERLHDVVRRASMKWRVFVSRPWPICRAWGSWDRLPGDYLCAQTGRISEQVSSAGGHMEQHYSREELEALLGSVGSDVSIDRSVRLFGGRSLHVGSHVRIDPFTIISSGAGVRIGDHVHIAQFCLLLGSGAPLTIEDFVGLASRVSIYTSSDDYTGGNLTNPTVPDEYRNVSSAPVTLGRHSVVGCGSVIMPGVILGTGASVGALTFVNKRVPDFAIVLGNPMRRIGSRDRERLLEVEAKFVNAQH